MNRPFSIEQSTAILSSWLMSNLPFFFVRIGDGAIECMSGRPGKTCDGEEYSESLAYRLKCAIQLLLDGREQVIWGDWRTAVAGSAPNYVAEWELMVNPPERRFVNYESLLMMRTSPQLLNFYSIVQRDRRRKLYLGPKFNQGAAAFLKASHLFTPTEGLFSQVDTLRDELLRTQPEVVLFGAGMAGLIAVVEYWRRMDRKPVCIHLGSALDPLFHRATRARQVPQASLRQFFQPLLEPAL